MAVPSDTIFEEREEVMVSLNGDSKPTLRTAHFLKPTTTSMDETEIPLEYSISPLPSCENWPLKVRFAAWRHRLNDWNAWVMRMQSMHQIAWKKAGIDEAILNSTYDIHKYDDLIFGLSEKWCANTNTFIFPWGEATITLEDVIVLGGYSVLGSPVSYSVQNRELKMIEGKLMDARVEIGRSRTNKASQGAWMKKFINSGSEIEHEAFLALWLSRYVFQSSSQIIKKEVLPIAIRLARGISIALAPAVLASIYRDLNQLKGAVLADNNESKLELFSPLHLVQLWAWERFQVLQPKPNMLNFGDPRSARWDKAKILKVQNVRLALDSAPESFLWRPYAKSLQNWSFPKFYREKEELVPVVDSGLDRHLQSFVRCLKVSRLAGLDYMENYSPHRVAMQFGMDQDLPGCVALDETREVAWMNYSKPKSDSKFYIPSRLFESDVTTRYLKWWKQSVLGQQDIASVPIQLQRKLELSKWDTQASKEKEKDRDPDVPPGFHPKSNIKELGSLVDKDKPAIVDVPPGFHPKSNIKELGNLVEKDKPAIVEMFTQQSFGDGELPGQSQGSRASFTHDGVVREMAAQPKSVQKISDTKVTVESSGRVMDDMGVGQESRAGIMTSNRVSIDGSVGVANSYRLETVPELETRIRMLEEEIAKLKAARRLGHRFE